jgi:predicted component of type VI protein secretion system
VPALLARSGPLAGRRFELADPEVILGRENAAITLADEETSRRHAAIRVIAGTVVIEDLGSTNGTFVDGRRIETTTELVGGETIRLGQSTFEVEVRAAPDPGATRVASRPDPDRAQPRQQPPARAAAQQPFGTVSAPRPRRRRGVASRKLGPTLASLATITSTAVALVVYFAGR